MQQEKRTVSKNNVGHGSETIDKAGLLGDRVDTVARALNTNTDHGDHNSHENTDERSHGQP